MSYTTGSGYDSYEIDSYLFQDGSIVDEDHDSDSSWAQGDIGCNNPTGYQNWTIRGYHTGWIQENDITNTTREIYNE